MTYTRVPNPPALPSLTPSASFSCSRCSWSISVLIIAKIRLTANAKLLLLWPLHSAICLDNFIYHQDVVPKQKTQRNCLGAKKERERERGRCWVDTCNALQIFHFESISISASRNFALTPHLRANVPRICSFLFHFC